MNRPYIFYFTSIRDGCPGVSQRMTILPFIRNRSWTKLLQQYRKVISLPRKWFPTTQTPFMAREGLSDETPVRFELQSAGARNGGSVWLRYKVCTAEGA